MAFEGPLKEPFKGSLLNGLLHVLVKWRPPTFESSTICSIMPMTGEAPAFVLKSLNCTGGVCTALCVGPGCHKGCSTP